MSPLAAVRRAASATRSGGRRVGGGGAHDVEPNRCKEADAGCAGEQVAEAVGARRPAPGSARSARRSVPLSATSSRSARTFGSYRRWYAVNSATSRDRAASATANPSRSAVAGGFSAHTGRPRWTASEVTPARTSLGSGHDHRVRPSAPNRTAPTAPRRPHRAEPDHAAARSPGGPQDRHDGARLRVEVLRHRNAVRPPPPGPFALVPTGVGHRPVGIDRFGSRHRADAPASCPNALSGPVRASHPATAAARHRGRTPPDPSPTCRPPPHTPP